MRTPPGETVRERVPQGPGDASPPPLPMPAARLDGPEHAVPIADALAVLRAESQGSAARGPARGHRQVTLFRGGSLRVVLFDFAPGARLPEHAAPADAWIQVIEGAVRIATPTTTHHLAVGDALALAPGRRHDLTADVRSAVVAVLGVGGPAAPPGAPTPGPAAHGAAPEPALR